MPNTTFASSLEQVPNPKNKYTPGKKIGYKQSSRNVYCLMLQLVATQLDVDAVAVRVEPVHQALQRLILHRI